MLSGVDLSGEDGELLPIGRFARLGRLSVKQLRRYDELGLLRPAYVDAYTGYRYYRPEQARVAMSIGLLRSLDVPLPVIGRVLAGAEGALEGVREALEAELERRRRTLASLERVMAHGLPAAEVRVVREPSRRVLAVRGLASGPGDVGRVTSAAVARLTGELAARSSGAPGPLRLVGVFPVELDEPVPVMVAAVLDGSPGAGSAAWESGGALEAAELPGGVFAAATHVGPYDQVGLTAHAVLAWCAERRRAVRGSMREVYVSDPAVTPPEELVTRVWVEVEEEE